MRTKILDRDALLAIAPKSLHAYLRMQGWSMIDHYGDKGDVYSLNDEPEIIAPASSDFADYSATISSILDILSRVEGRPQISLFNDLTVADTDLIRVRVPEAEDDGSISIQTGVDLIQQSRDLLLAAACSASKPQRAYRSGRIQEASNYIEDVRIGQTERGSFVVTLISPVPPSLVQTNQGSLWPEISEEPFQRKVTRTLSTALGAMKDALAQVNRGEDISAFESRIAQGVSANICEATGALIRDGEGLDVSLTWALTRPTPDRRTSTTFTKADAVTLNEAAKLLREKEPRPAEQIEGFVVALARESSAIEGKVTVKTPIDGKMSSVKIDFGTEDYSRILEAHEHRRAITLEGDLERQGQRWVLSNPRNLIVSSQDDEEAE